ncbi:MAG TPA: hypothetical protein VHX39_10620 [Acetobacteraceae bacterium]|jgi:hypothetical protein|nr:hypothetical protein [Acetobacteraceae bacterium]
MGVLAIAPGPGRFASGGQKQNTKQTSAKALAEVAVIAHGDPPMMADAARSDGEFAEALAERSAKQVGRI